MDDKKPDDPKQAELNARKFWLQTVSMLDLDKIEQQQEQATRPALENALDHYERLLKRLRDACGMLSFNVCDRSFKKMVRKQWAAEPLGPTHGYPPRPANLAAIRQSMRKGRYAVALSQLKKSCEILAAAPYSVYGSRRQQQLLWQIDSINLIKECLPQFTLTIERTPGQADIMPLLDIAARLNYVQFAAKESDQERLTAQFYLTPYHIAQCRRLINEVEPVVKKADHNRFQSLPLFITQGSHTLGITGGAQEKRATNALRKYQTNRAAGLNLAQRLTRDEKVQGELFILADALAEARLACNDEAEVKARAKLMELIADTVIRYGPHVGDYYRDTPESKTR